MLDVFLNWFFSQEIVTMLYNFWNVGFDDMKGSLIKVDQYSIYAQIKNGWFMPLLGMFFAFWAILLSPNLKLKANLGVLTIWYFGTAIPMIYIIYKIFKWTYLFPHFGLY